jgi:hypothetical protein
MVKFALGMYDIVPVCNDRFAGSQGHIYSCAQTMLDGVVKSLLDRHPGESRGPERLEITGFRLSPE